MVEVRRLQHVLGHPKVLRALKSERVEPSGQATRLKRRLVLLHEAFDGKEEAASGEDCWRSGSKEAVCAQRPRVVRRTWSALTRPSSTGCECFAPHACLLHFSRAALHEALTLLSSAISRAERAATRRSFHLFFQGLSFASGSQADVLR